MDEEHIIKVVNFVQKRPIFAVFRPDLTEKESFYILDDVFNGAVFFHPSVQPKIDFRLFIWALLNNRKAVGWGNLLPPQNDALDLR